MKHFTLAFVGVLATSACLFGQGLEPIPAPLPEPATGTPTLADPRFESGPQPTPAEPRTLGESDVAPPGVSENPSLIGTPQPAVTAPGGSISPSRSGGASYRWVPGRSTGQASHADAPPTPRIRYQVYERRDRWGRSQLVLVEQAAPRASVASYEESRRRRPTSVRVLATEPVVTYRSPPVRATPATVRLSNGATVLAVPVPAYVPGQPIRNAIRARRF